MSARADGWANILTSQGTVRDSRHATRFAPSRELTNEELDDLYEGNGLARRIVDEPANLITRDPWQVAGDADGALWTYLEARSAMVHLRRLLRWARLYGGAVLVMGVADGGSLESPINLASVKTLDFLRVYDRYAVQNLPDDWTIDPRDKRFGMREFYRVRPLAQSASGAGAEFRAHWTRVIEVDGLDIGDRRRLRRQGWGASVLQLVYEGIERFGEGLDNAHAVIRDFVQGVLTVKGLSQILARQDGDQLIKARLELLDLTRHVLNTMLLDDGETYTKQISSVAGVPEILDRLMAAVSSDSGIPQTVLFGRSPAGMNATGEADTRGYYDFCGAYQRETLGPALQRLAEVAVNADDFDGESAEELLPAEFRFGKLWQPTEAEQATQRKTVAETDAIYIDRQVLMPEEVALARFGGDAYSADTALLVERDPEAAAEEEEAAAAARAAAEADAGAMP